MTTTTLVEKSSLNISFAATIDRAGALQLLYNGQDFSGGLEVECDATEVVTFKLNGFQHANKLWSVSGDPRLPKPDPAASLAGPWTTDTVQGNMSLSVEVTLTASAHGETPKKQKIFIKTRPRTGVPDSQMK
jgi:hypothetical protein